MRQSLRWPVAAAWAVVGVLAGCALVDPFDPGMLLLVPAAVLGGWLLWTFDRGRETGAVLVGLVVLPLTLLVRARNPTCPVDGGFLACEPGPAWPWIALAALLVLGSSLVLAGPRRPTGSAPTA